MRRFTTLGAAAAAALLTSAGLAGAAPGGRSEVEAGASATRHSHSFPAASAGGRSDFRHGGFVRFGGAAGGEWGFDHRPPPPGFRRDYGRRHRDGYRFLYGYAGGPYGYGYGADPYGPQEAYGDAAGEIGYPPEPPPYAPALAQGPYGPGAHRQGPDSPYRGQAYVSGGGAYAYGYNGYAETPEVGAR